MSNSTERSFSTGTLSKLSPTMYICLLFDLLARPDVADPGILLEAVQYGGLWILDILFHPNRSWRPMHEVITHGTLQSPTQRGPGGWIPCSQGFANLCQPIAWHAEHVLPYILARVIQQHRATELSDIITDRHLTWRTNVRDTPICSGICVHRKRTSRSNGLQYCRLPVRSYLIVLYS
jgi:hypothetical protein